MTLLDRYLHEVGRHLPRGRRDDILAELRSSLLDRLEDLAGDKPTEEDMVALLTEMGRPRDVAASYFPEGQYLIGPTLFPLFRMVATIAVLASVGGQLIAWLVATFIGGANPSLSGTLSSLLNSIPITLGIVVIVFAVLQRLDVRPELLQENWDPRQLPQPASGAPLKRGERIAGIIFGLVFLGIFTAFSDRIGIYNLEDGSFLANPVFGEYVLWITLSIVVGIGVDIYLLWRGVWDRVGRLAKIGSNAVSLVVLGLLFQAHNEWLAARGLGTVLETLDQIGVDGAFFSQVAVMQFFRLGIGIALIVVTVETVAMVVRFARSLFSGQEPVAVLVVGKD